MDGLAALIPGVKAWLLAIRWQLRRRDETGYDYRPDIGKYAGLGCARSLVSVAQQIEWGSGLSPDFTGYGLGKGDGSLY